MTLALGMVRPGSTILIPFNTFDSNDPSDSVIVSAFVLADIGIYKGTSMTERASTTGVVLLDTDGINIDGAVGIHGFTIDLSSDATTDFYEAGQRYYVTVGPITVDGATTVSFIAATFEIGYPDAILNTTIATLASQVSFTLDAGPAEASALLNCVVVVHDKASAVQTAIGHCSVYGTSLTVTLGADPGVFTMAAGDNVSFFPPANVGAISADAVAADNLELQYDATGLTGGTFPATQDAVGAIGTVGGAALNFAAADDNVDGALNGITLVGVQTSGTFVSTEAEQGTYHVIDDDTNNIDLVYQFNIGGGRTATEVLWKGYLSNNGDSINVQVYDFVGTDWETVRVLVGKNQAINETLAIPILAKHTGTGANIGIVYVRFVVASATNPTLNTDSIIVEAVNIGTSVGYLNGAVAIDTVNGVAGTEVDVNGVWDNPVLTLADAITIAAAKNLTRFQVIIGSTITFGESHTGEVWVGDNWTLDLSGEDISNIYVSGADVSGIGTGSGTQIFIDCIMNASTLPAGTHLKNGELEGKYTMGSAGVHTFDNMKHGSSSPSIIDWGSGLNASTVHMHPYNGAVEFENMGAGAGNYVAHMNGDGKLVFNANCSATSTVNVAGNWEIEDNAGGAVTVNEVARYDNVAEEAILTDTAEMQPKLPANFIMGSSDGADDDGTLNAITAAGPTKTEMDTAHALLATVADLLEKVGAVDEAAAAGDPSATESVMQYVKQLVNILVGSDGIVTWPSAAAPGNGVSIAEAIRFIEDQTDDIGVAGAGLTDLGGMSTGMKAEIESEVNDALDTAIAELGVAAPTATPTIRTGLMLLYMTLRNKTVVQTSGTDALEIYNNAGTKIAAKLLTDDGSDYTEAEMA